jgi:hypothetical protein
MPRSNFDEKLRLPAKGGTLKVSGPIPPGETVEWLWVWIFQNRPTKTAAARGYGKNFIGNKWEVDLQMAPNSDDFMAGRPALGSALARVSDGGQKEIYWWSEAIRVVKP